jgi:cholesterol transport system auxiliary component
MSGPAGRIARRWLPGAAVLALAGCASLLGVAPPGHLYRLTADSRSPGSLPHVGGVLIVDRPQAPAGIDTTRIALSRSPISLDYYADSEWTDRVPALLQGAILASFENSGAITAIDRESIGLRASFILETQLRHFEAEYAAGVGLPRVWVAVVVRLVAMPRRALVAQAAFERRVPAAADNIPDVVAAFNAATDAVIGDVVSWTLAHAALSAPRG